MKREAIAPVNIPTKLKKDPELYRFFNELTNSVYQIWFGYNGNKMPVLVSSTESIDVTLSGEIKLFKVPNNKEFIPLYAVIRITEFISGAKSTHAIASFGGNDSSYNDFLGNTTYTVNNSNIFQINRANKNTVLAVQQPGNNFKIKINASSNASKEIWAVDLFGYLV